MNPLINHLPTTKIPAINNSYIAVGVIAILNLLLNKCTATYQCAFIFTNILLVVGIYAVQKKHKAAYQLIILGILTSLPIYITTGSFNSKLELFSLTSLLISALTAINVTSQLPGVKKPLLLLVTLLVAALVDGLLMSTYFIAQPSYHLHKVLAIFTRELCFKSLYAIIACAIFHLSASTYRTN